MRSKEHDLNAAAFRSLEESIKENYPHGQYIAFVGGQLTADAADFDELHSKLKSAGKDPYQALIVQAGHSYPKYATILLHG